jgi:hypothetical protein
VAADISVVEVVIRILGYNLLIPLNPEMLVP